MSPLFRLGRIAIVAILLIPFALLVLSIGAFTAIVPSGSPNTMKLYKSISERTFSKIHWEDPYIFDYFRRHNDFSQISSQQIQSTVNLFYKIIWVFVGYSKYGQPVYVPKKVPVSLLTVMMNAGYSQSDYQAALQLESVAASEMQSLGGTQTGPLQPVTLAQMHYQSVDTTILYDYVHQQGSIFSLSDIQTIVDAAHRYNINPILMIAITGQEESFVPATWPQASFIRNNPFNVYHSWQQYNTNLADAANIAANTLAHKLITPPPQGENPIAWINDPMNPWGIYAQDTNWSYGVDDIFHALSAYVAAH
ncbi:hypothetical protein LLE49_24800 [Alicyclobacillus tolerans]|uniref:hypothetical protein n=1 Tax=Alicyclobacillus tolerans TaxID=90970 RepID=UPI001F1F081A|nr:hypothetical protein [Alicyclobacillus tolerans]MCF8567947.1 hypothetical protein [Alicyclobacillus tolerans]